MCVRACVLVLKCTIKSIDFLKNSFIFPLLKVCVFSSLRSCVVMLSYYFLSFEIWMQISHSPNYYYHNGTIVGHFVAHIARVSECGKEEQKESIGCHVLLCCLFAPFDHRISLKTRAASRNIKSTSLCLYPCHVCVSLMLKHSTQLLYCLLEGVYFYFVSVQSQEKMKVIDETTFWCAFKTFKKTHSLHLVATSGGL